jgi:uncharacterized membrane protein
LKKISLDSPSNRTWSFTTERIVIAGVLAAITIVFGVVPGIGFIPVPTISGSATIEHVPTILGGVLAGPVVGIVTGLIFGLMSFTHATTPLFKDPLVAILPRLFIGLVAWAVFAGLKPLNRDVAAAAAGFLGSATNTVLVVAMLVIRGYIPLAVAFTLIPQALAEAIIAMILTVILARVFFIIQKRYIRAADTKPREELPY